MISVLIPTYNRAGLIPEAIESVLGQTIQDFELLIIDDGSTDGTEAVVCRYPRARYIYQEHAGIAVARNRALSEANGRLVAWLDSDDLWMPDKLEKQMAYMEDHPECRMVLCGLEYFGDTADDYGPFSSLQSALMDVKLYEEIGGYNCRYRIGEDTEWLYRAAMSGIDVRHCIPDKLYWVRVHPKQSTNDVKISSRDYLAIVASAARHIQYGGQNHENRNSYIT